MSEWILPLFEPAYNGVAYDRKDVEARVPDPSKPEKQYWRIQPGDTLVFRAINSENFKPLDLPELRFPVTYQNRYETVEDMLMTEGLHRALPGVKSIEEGVKIYMSFPGYPNRIAENGIVAIGLGERLS